MSTYTVQPDLQICLETTRGPSLVIFQEAGQVVWYSHLFQNFPQFIVLHTVKGFGIVNKAEIDVFLELSCFFDDPANVVNLISGSSAFSTHSLDLRFPMQWQRQLAALVFGGGILLGKRRFTDPVTTR